VIDFRRNIGMLLLAVYLILYGLAQVIGLTFQHEGLVWGILTLAAGILLLLGR
jgi:hypothetical protein